MRILVDLHAVQPRDGAFEPGDECLGLIRALTQCAGQEILVMANSANPDCMTALRHSLKNTLLPQKVLAVQGPAAHEEISSPGFWRQRAVGMLREHLIANVSPDWICLPLRSTLQSRPNMPGIRPGIQAARTVLCLFGSAGCTVENAGQEAFHPGAGSLLTLAGLVVVRDSATRRELVTIHGLEKDRVVVCASGEEPSEPLERKRPDSKQPSLSLGRCAGHLVRILESYTQGPGGISEAVVEEPAGSLPRLAYVAPQPPDQSVIADYSAKLIPELARHYKIELVRDEAMSGQGSSANFSTCGVADFEERAGRGDYDRILYQMGNHPVYGRMLELIRRYPGTVILQDFYLGQAGSREPAQLARRLYESHGYPGLLCLECMGKEAAAQKYPVNYGVLRHSGGILAPSASMTQLAETWYGDRVPRAWNEIPPERVGAFYRDVMESHFLLSARQRERRLLRELALEEGEAAPDAEQLARLSQALVQARPVEQAQLLVDVSAIARNDLKTGIERVVRAQIKSLLDNGPRGYRLEPVYLTSEGGRWHYRYARDYACGLLGVPRYGLSDEPVAVHPGDILYIPDRFSGGLIQATKAGLYKQWRALGVRVHVLIHDLLPISMPQSFPEGAPEDHAQYIAAAAECADALGSISKATQRALETWLEKHPPRRPDPLAFWNLPHGADQWEKPPGTTEDARVEQALREAACCPTLIAVGTVEPRKGYPQLLDAFDRLRQMGREINLILVGKAGWTQLPAAQRRTIPGTVRRLGKHRERGHRLFWLSGIGDEDLARLYAASTALVAASEGEGFGLPLIEAAQAGLPVIARDIPVFREVAGRGAWYFRAETAEELAEAIRDWLALFAKGQHPDPADIEWLTWDENARRLSGFLVDGGLPSPNPLPQAKG